jgi:hypothetical protein
MLSLYEVDWGGSPFYWDVYDEEDNFVRVVEAEYLDEYLDFLRGKGVDFALYTQDYYLEYHLALEA